MSTTDTVYMAWVFLKPGEEIGSILKGFPILMTRAQRDAIIKSPDVAKRFGACVLNLLQEQASEYVPHDGEEYLLQFLNVEAIPRVYAQVLEQVRQEGAMIDVTGLEVGIAPSLTDPEMAH